MTGPLVSIVTPARNARETLKATRDSVLGQSLTAFEWIVVDDRSEDGTGGIARASQDARVQVLRGEGAGVSAARNLGLNAAKAPYVLFLDADDCLLPDALAQMVERLEANPQAIACMSHHIKMSEEGKALDDVASFRAKPFPVKDTLGALIRKNIIVNGGALCIRTAAARQVGGFSSQLKLGEDWEFWCRLALLGDFVPLEEPCVLYRQSASGANTRLRGEAGRPNFEAIEAIYANPDLQGRYPQSVLAQARRMAEMDAFWSAARNALVQKRIKDFASYLGVGALRYPDALMHPRLIWLFLRSAGRMLRA